RLARRYADLTPGDHADAQVLARLTAADEGLICRVAATARRAAQSTYRVPGPDVRVSFGFRDPVLTVTSFDMALPSSAPGMNRVSMLRDGSWSDVYRGGLRHFPVACIDSGNVVAVRQDDEHGFALVHYAAGREKPVMHGEVTGSMYLEATAAGFMAGFSMPWPAALAAGPGLAPVTADLRSFWPAGGVFALAVNPAGDVVAFGGPSLALTDAWLDHVVARPSVLLPHGEVRSLAFTGQGELVVSGYLGGLSRWRVQPG
ncbi:MAG: hypothetical protein ACRDN0_11725, partial [Trebonia sp.]